VSEKAWEQLRSWSREPSTAAVLTDIDGVLAPIVPTPDLSEVPEELRGLLQRLSEMYLVVAGISGRAAEDALRLVGLEEIAYYGNHGFEVLRPGDDVEIVPEAEPYKNKVEELENKAREELEPLGAFVEEKGITASIHYRNVSPENGERCKEFVEREGERLGLRITVGRGVVEARPPIRADKGTATRKVVEEYEPRKALFIGFASQCSGDSESHASAPILLKRRSRARTKVSERGADHPGRITPITATDHPIGAGIGSGHF
jgi:trehalose 6-phosphate phosphatase